MCRLDAADQTDENGALTQGPRAQKVGDDQMLKRIIAAQQETEPAEDNWLNLDELAQVEITSENPAHPIEAALLAGHTGGWRAATTGKQTIRLLFNGPQPVRRIRLDFYEPDIERTQEYVLRWSPDNGQAFHDIVRQQWHFSPRGAAVEKEDHRCNLPLVTVLELSIIPNMSGGPAVASLAQLRLA